jgi:hypothetical protein
MAAPLWSRAEEAEAIFEARRVGRGGLEPRIGALLVVVTLGAVIALGNLGSAEGPEAPQLPEAARLQAAAAASSAATVTASGSGFLTRSAEGGWPPLRVTGFGSVPVRLASPSPDRAITTAFVAVKGTVHGRPHAVRIVLETSDHRLLRSTLVDTRNVHGGIRPDRAPTVDVRLALPAPRPVGDRLWVLVTAYDERGTPLGSMRRPVDVGPLAASGGG